MDRMPPTQLQFYYHRLENENAQQKITPIYPAAHYQK